MIGGGPTNPFASQHHLFDRNAVGTHRILEHLRRFADDKGVVLIGELADVDPAAVGPDLTRDGRRLHAVYDFSLINCHPEVDAITETLQRRGRCLGDGWFYNVFTNHDSVRAVSNLTGFAVGQNRLQATKLLLFMQLTLRGGCIIYQGEELGLPHPELAFEDLIDPWAKACWPTFKGRDGARTPFPCTCDAPAAGFSEGDPWLPVADAHLPLALEAQENDPDSVPNFLWAFLDWRRGQPVLLLSDEHMSRSERAPVISWWRTLEGAELRVLVNFSCDEAFMPVEPSWCPVAAPGCVSTREEHGLSLGPLQFAILSEG